MAIIGKNVIENLTQGMYENKYTIFREFIQNSADSIDKAIKNKILDKYEANIDIYIDKNKRSITIYDNAMGISKDNFIKTLSSIADSEKDRKEDKGFRGIGRLAGIAYCKKLIFRSSFLGEDIESEMIWDGELLRSILLDKNNHLSASEVIDKIITCKEKKCNKDEHFFKVVLVDITKENDDLLDANEVIEYLKSVAPVPYDKFIFKSKIYEFIKQQNIRLDEYSINLNGNPIFKCYGTYLYEKLKDGSLKKYDEIKDIVIKEFKEGENLIAWAWIGVSSYEKNIPLCNKMRGLRLRKENIQIGDERTLDKFFKEARGNGYFIGEIFILDSEIIPNARRDYFNQNEELMKFEDLLKPFLHFELYTLYHFASEVRLAVRDKNEYLKVEKEYHEKANNGTFTSKEEKEKLENTLKVKHEKAIKAENKLKNKKMLSEVDNIKKRVYDTLINSLENEEKIKSGILDETLFKNIDNKSNSNENVTIISQKNENNKENIKKDVYLAQSLSNYNKSERKLVGKIYGIIENILPKDMSELIIKKIQEELSK